MREAFALFCDAPWQFVGGGLAAPIRTNIIRAELEASARLLGITMTPPLFQDIRAMEDEALKVWARKR